MSIIFLMVLLYVALVSVGIWPNPLQALFPETPEKKEQRIAAVRARRFDSKGYCHKHNVKACYTCSCII